MTIEQTPAPARSDVRRAAPAAPAAPASGAVRHPYAREGTALTVGASAWAASMLAVGLDPAEGSWGHVASGAGSGLFQLGLLALLSVLWRTRALGEGRLARFFLRLEAVLVTLAIGSTVADTVGVSDLGSIGWALLDACWPFSMMGMFLIGIRIAIAGRWTGASRYWPMVAESWAVVVIPTLGIFGETAAGVVAPLHLLGGYAVLGVLVARKEA